MGQYKRGPSVRWCYAYNLASLMVCRADRVVGCGLRGKRAMGLHRRLLELYNGYSDKALVAAWGRLGQEVML